MPVSARGILFSTSRRSVSWNPASPLLSTHIVTCQTLVIRKYRFCVEIVELAPLLARRGLQLKRLPNDNFLVVRYDDLIIKKSYWR